MIAVLPWRAASNTLNLSLKGSASVGADVLAVVWQKKKRPSHVHDGFKKRYLYSDTNYTAGIYLHYGFSESQNHSITEKKFTD